MNRTKVLSALVATLIPGLFAAAPASPQEPGAIPRPPAVPAPRRAPPPAARDWAVQFGAEGSRLRPATQTAIDEAAAYALSAYSGRVTVTVHAGSLRLAERRTAALAAAFAAKGLDASRVKAVPHQGPAAGLIEVRFPG